MKTPFNSPRRFSRSTAKALAVVVVVVTAWLAGFERGESHAAAVTAAAAIDEANAMDNAYCGEVFGSDSAVASQFHSPALTLDTSSTYLVTGHDICAYRRVDEKKDELVLFVLSTKPNNLVGRLGVRTQSSVEVKSAEASAYVVAASTDADVPVSSSDDPWLLSAGTRALR